MHIPESGEHAHSFGGYDFRSLGNFYAAYLPNGLDALILYYDYAVLEGSSAKAINQRASNKGFDLTKAREGCQQTEDEQDFLHNHWVESLKVKINHEIPAKGHTRGLTSPFLMTTGTIDN